VVAREGVRKKAGINGSKAHASILSCAYRSASARGTWIVRSTG
jgi:hypothetical protein